MATKSFSLNTVPHVADIGGVELLFQPEVMGDDFMDAYQSLIDAQKSSGVSLDDLSGVDPAQLRNVSRALRDFLARLMLPESAELFTRLDVVVDGKPVESFADGAEAEAYAAEIANARVVDGLRLPDRVLVELLEWVVELFGGGQRPPTSSGGSAAASPQPGRRGTGVSPSMGSTRTRGR
ncbi:MULTISPECIES: hypothetical protein [unclassified Streptomyces]|uniref:hypothetical protein n=1 Tax=unclassified Streptomyces TaxID=2593676 RepID=UPI0033E3CCB6|nr:hypothetical protein OIE70_37175 [Streptomyces sp. NBC_01744]